MDSIASWCVAALMLLMAAFQSIYVAYYCLSMRRPGPGRGEHQPDNRAAGAKTLPQEGVAEYQPQVAVILCLRGADPSLTDCFAGLASQEYPKYDLHIVVDHPSDPALGVIRDYYEGRVQPKIHTLSRPQENCSLKCSAILEAESKLPDEVEVIALIDADTIPDQHWLSDLIQPLSNPEIARQQAIVGLLPKDLAWDPTSGISGTRRPLFKCRFTILPGEARWRSNAVVSGNVVLLTDGARRFAKTPY